MKMFPSLFVLLGAISCCFTLGRCDSDAAKDAYQLIVSKGYPCQMDTVTTDDGYILTMHRIPYGKKSPGSQQNVVKPVVFLQHGLFCSSADWVMNAPEQSLGFMLADAGYDVWMGNVRGNTYGKKHTTLNPDVDKSQFWDFTFDEMAEKDLPAMIQHALDVTKQSSLYYIGHSQGSSMGFALFSENPEWSKSKIQKFIALGPVAYLGNAESPIKYLSPLAGSLTNLLNLIGQFEFLPSSSFTQWLASYFCDTLDQPNICSNILFVTLGYDAVNMNNTRLPVYIAHDPAGTSSKNVAHFAQMFGNGKFQKYDYGGLFGSNNINYYGSTNVPQYDPTKISVPTTFFYGDIDIVVAVTDVLTLQSMIPTMEGSYQIGNMDHMDFVLGLNAAPQVYTKILTILAAHN